MDDLSKEHVISFFNRSLMTHGDRPEAVRWSREGQIRHYEALLDVGDLKGKRVLDFGCGKGDFLGFLRGKDIQVDYTGLDLNSRLIEVAQKKYPGVTFGVFDIDRETLAGKFDYIVLCGVFNLRVEGLDETIRRTLKILFYHCTKGLAFNALSSHDPRKDFELHYVSPEEMFSFAVTHLSPYACLRHDRMLYDFTLCVYRELNYVRD